MMNFCAWAGQLSSGMTCSNAIAIQLFGVAHVCINNIQLKQSTKKVKKEEPVLL